MADIDEPFDRPGLGDNNPPEPTALERAEELIPACDGWTSKGQLTSADEAQVLSEFLVQIRKAREAIKAGTDRQPHLDAIAAIMATVAHRLEPHQKALEEIGARSVTMLAKLDLAIERIQGSKKVTGLLADWMARENKRLQDEADNRRREAEEAERIAQTMADKAALSGTIDSAIEAEAAIEAADKARDSAERRPQRARVKGDLAPKAVSLHAYWSAKIVDWKEARKHYRTAPRVKEAYDDAVQLVANDDARRLKDPAKAPPGVEFQKREQAQ